MGYTRLGGYYDGQGGEFTLYQDGSNAPLSNAAYSSWTGGKGNSAWASTSFQTFCLEATEYVAQPLELYVSSQNAELSGPGSHAYAGGTGVGDDLSPYTAYLYTQFATGQMTGDAVGNYGYAYTGNATVPGFSGLTDLTRADTAGALQRLIWHLQSIYWYHYYPMRIVFRDAGADQLPGVLELERRLVNHSIGDAWLPRLTELATAQQEVTG